MYDDGGNSVDISEEDGEMVMMVMMTQYLTSLSWRKGRGGLGEFKGDRK